MQVIRIIVLCILLAVVYGIVHDLVTAHVCVEYFTIGHPPVFQTASPVLLALGWGVIATWWGGLILGVLLAVAAQMGSRPKRDMRSVIRPAILLLAFMAAAAILASVVGYFLAEYGLVFLLKPLANRVPAEKHSLFLADLWAHTASYVVGFVGGIIVCVRVWKSRKR